MATIDISRNHSLGLERARVAIEAIAAKLGESVDARYRWEGDNLLLERPGATGKINVTADSVRVEINLGFALRLLKGKVTKRVHDYLDEDLVE